jgi:hypothetical protein
MVLAKPNRFRLRKQLVALKKISIVEGVQQANSPKDEMNWPIFQAMTTKPVRYARKATGHSSAAYEVVRVSERTVSSTPKDQIFDVRKIPQGMLTKVCETMSIGSDWQKTKRNTKRVIKTMPKIYISPSSSTVASKPESDEVADNTDVAHLGLNCCREKFVSVFVGDVPKSSQERGLTVITRKLSPISLKTRVQDAQNTHQLRIKTFHDQCPRERKRPKSRTPMGPHGLFEPVLFLGVDKQKAFVE